MPNENERRIALYLDLENLVTNTGISAATLDLKPAFDRLLEKGKVIVRRAYCDWARFREAKATLHELGFELIDVPPSTRSGKNGADMRLVIDALELCYAREYVDTFVIGSGDSDFCPLAYKLRENDRTVIGIGVRESTSRLLVKACDEFVYLKPAAAAPKRKAEEKKADKHEKPEKAKKGGREQRPAKKIPDIARDVVQSLLARATGPLNPSLIKETIVRKEPDFDERDHGFSTFSRLLEAMEKERLLKRQQMGTQWYVVPAEGPHPSPTEDQELFGDAIEPLEPAPDDGGDEIPF